MFRPSASAIKITSFIVLTMLLIGYWLWTTDRNWKFVYAAGHGDLAKVRAGLDSGIDPNRASMKGATALDFATNSRKPGQPEIIRLLVDRGADPNKGVSKAAAGQPPDTIRFLLDRGANPTSGLCSAVDANRPGIVQLLIARGADVNAKCDSPSRSVLLEAAGYSSNEIIRMLKAAGARK